MGKPTGFMEYDRAMPGDRAPQDRINDWDEFHQHFSIAKQKIQGARCMDCGIPFCHTGITMKGMLSGCPLNNLIPEWNDLIFRGLWKEAVTRLLKTNNFPEFTGRVCPAPCEGACTAGLNSPPITIKINECAIIDRAFDEGWIEPVIPAKRTGKKVAVIGSGPAGLACADQLNKAGHLVTVFERSDRIGGLLMYGIPNMKLQKRKVVQRRVNLMTQEGITFVTNTEVGKDYPVENLKTEFDAVVLCTGATNPRDLSIKGRNFNGVHFAVDFLTENTKSLLDSDHRNGKYINAAGKDVIVIGGGDTGTDCIGTSIRHGCKSIMQLEIMPQLPIERSSGEPWPIWPRLFKVDYGQEEAIEVFGQDPREYCITAKEFLGDEDGNLKAVHLVNVQWKSNESGGMTPVEIPRTERVVPAQLVLLAMGFTGPEDQLLVQLGITRDNRTNIQAEYGKFNTNIDGVFAAGDSRRGQSLVVWAINEGRGAARECDKFLMGTTNLP